MTGTTTGLGIARLCSWARYWPKPPMSPNKMLRINVCEDARRLCPASIGKRRKSMRSDLPRLISLATDDCHAPRPRRAFRRLADAAKLSVLLTICILVGSSGSSAGQPQASPAAKKAAAQPQAPATPNKAAAQPAASGDVDLPPIVKLPWKGDLDAIAKRRALRVLVPFRRPEFFYMEGQPVGILQEAFQEIEKVLNTKYKTTAANRIVVVLLPTPMDRMRERMDRRLWRYCSGKHFDHGSAQGHRGLHRSDENRDENHCSDRAGRSRT